MFAISLIVLTLSSFKVLTADGDIYRDECAVWTDEINRITTTEPRLNVNCKVNAPCTGFDCNGKYAYEGILTGGDQYEKDLCFGLWINPCNTPSDLTVYIEQRSDNLSFSHVYSNDEKNNADIPGYHEAVKVPYLGTAATATVTIETDIKHLTINNQPYMTIGLIIKPKINYAGMYEDYPKELQVALVKDVDVPVPVCDKNVLLTTHKPQTCPDISGQAVVTSSPQKPTNNTSVCPKSQTKLCDRSNVCKCVNTTDINTAYIRCKQGMYDSCKSLQYGGCNLHDNATNMSYCDCSPHYQRNSDGKCEFTMSTTTQIPIIPENVDYPRKHSVSKNVIIIVSCSIAAIVIALLATGFVMWRYRHHRIRYGSHRLLRNADDDDDGNDDGDVPPINLDT